MDIQASRLPLVLACNGSVSMEASPASIELPTDDREDGLAAHSVATAVLSGLISDPLEYVDRATPNGVFVTPEMAEHVAVYTDRIADMGYTGHAEIGVEQNVDFAIPNSDVVVRARPDWFAFDTGSLTLHVKDFKYGYRYVEPFENWTLLAYAIGICLRFNWQPAMIVFEIVQPRSYHSDGPIREWSISAEEMTVFCVVLFQKLASLKDELTTNPYCGSCRALAHCPAARQASYNAIDTSTHRFTDQITGPALAMEIINFRRAAKLIEERLAAYEELAMHQIDHAGVNSVPGFNVEQQYGNRAITGGMTPEIVAIMTGRKVEEITTRKMITPAAMERLGIDEQVIKSFTYRPPTKRKLVEFDPSKAAKKLFG